MNFITEIDRITGEKSNLKHWTACAAEVDFFGTTGLVNEKHAIKIYKLIKNNLKQALESNIEYIKTFALLIRDHDDEAYSSEKHRYKKGDIVGIVGDCMADCKIIKLLPNKEYELTAIKIHHPNPKESFFGKNKKIQSETKTNYGEIMSWKYASMSDCKDPKNRRKKICCCGCHSAHDRKKSKTHHSTANRIEIRKARKTKERFK